MEPTDETLVEQYSSGTDAALVVLIERHFRSIYGYVYRFVHTSAEAEDITQEVFIKLWKHIDRFKPGTGLRPWLFRIARNTAIDYIRKKKHIPLSAFEEAEDEHILSDDSNALEEAIGREDQALLSGAVEVLPERYREIILLRAEGLTFEEIGSVVKKPLNTVKSLYRRGLAQLHQIIHKKRTN